MASLTLERVPGDLLARLKREAAEHRRGSLAVGAVARRAVSHRRS